jgi:hypothetical protein
MKTSEKTTNTSPIIDLFELKDELQYTQNKLMSKINENGLSKHLPLSTLKKLELIDTSIEFQNDFAFLGVIPSQDEKTDAYIVIPVLGNFEGEIYLFDSKHTPFKKVEKIISYTIRNGGYAHIEIDGLELKVGVTPNNDVLTDKENLNDKKDGVLLPNYLGKPRKIGTPLKSRVFEIGKIYQVIKVHDERGEYFEQTNQKLIETGVLVDVKIDDKNTVNNVICNSKLERMLNENDLKTPMNFLIVDKKPVNDKKSKKVLKVLVKIINPDKKITEYNIDDLDLI